jgi:integrase/recombinase XerD
VALDIGDLDTSSGALIVRQGKGGKKRVTALGAKTRREVLRYLRLRGETREGDPLWVTDEGTRLTYAGLRQIVRRRACKAGVLEPSLHDFRRAFCLACLRGGVDLVSLQRLMGHADLSLISRYAQQVEDDLIQAHRKGGPVDRLM